MIISCQATHDAPRAVRTVLRHPTQPATLHAQYGVSMDELTLADADHDIDNLEKA